MPHEDEPLDNTVVFDHEAGQQYVWNQRTVYTSLMFVLIPLTYYGCMPTEATTCC